MKIANKVSNPLQETTNESTQPSSQQLAGNDIFSAFLLKAYYDAVVQTASPENQALDGIEQAEAADTPSKTNVSDLLKEIQSLLPNDPSKKQSDQEQSATDSLPLASPLESVISSNNSSRGELSPTPIKKNNDEIISNELIKNNLQKIKSESESPSTSFLIQKNNLEKEFSVSDKKIEDSSFSSLILPKKESDKIKQPLNTGADLGSSKRDPVEKMTNSVELWVQPAQKEKTNPDEFNQPKQNNFLLNNEIIPEPPLNPVFHKKDYAKQNTMATDKVEKTTFSPLEQSEQITAPTIISSNKIHEVSEKNNYTDVFHQLGHFIKEQLSAYFEKGNTKEAIQNLNTARPVVADNFSKNLQTSLGSSDKLDVITGAPRLDLMMKQAYDAVIKIHPPELGSVTAKLKLNKNSAELVMVADNDRVKEIIQASLPELKQHFHVSEINLTHVEVNTSLGDAKQGSGGEKNEPHQPNQVIKEAEKSSILPVEAKRKKENTLIDTYV